MKFVFEVSCLLVVIHASDVYGLGCQTLDGTWYNQLGSQMILNHTTDGELYGEYRTTVERETGASGSGHSDIIGASPYNTPGATVAFAVLFKGGASITAWTGQCLMCDGEEVLLTSWLLREHVYTCEEKWRSTRIGQDKFLRQKQVPEFSLKSGSGVSPAYNLLHGGDALGRQKRFTVACGLDGTWYNEMGSEVILRHGANNYITGEYRTAVEVSQGSAGTSHSKVYGLGNVYSSETTFALFVVWRGGASVTGWVGQCHLCGANKTEILEVNWLLRTGVNGCDDNWKATNYGQNSFTRHEQAPGPRRRHGIHTPQQEGEDDLAHDLDLEKQTTCMGAQITAARIFTTLVLFIVCLM